MKIQTIVIGVLMGSLFMFAIGLFMGNVASNYPVTYSNESDLYVNLESTYNDSLEIQSSLNTTTDTASSDLLGTLLDKGVAAVKITGGSVRNSVQMTSAAANEIGIPYQIQLGMISIILVGFVILLIKLFSRSDT